MATIIAGHEAGPDTGSSRRAEEAAGAWLVWLLLFCSACIIIGLLWDISWHMSIGRDRLWSPPHVLEQIGASLAGLACGFVVLQTTFAGTAAQRAGTVRFWGFRGPLGGWVAIWGAFAMIFSVPFDDWWHNAYGLDVQILSPPHVVLLCGMIAIQIGAMLLALGMQNRASDTIRGRFGLAFAIAAGALIAMAATAVSEYTLRANDWHSSLTWKVAALVFPIFLVAIGRAGRFRFPATTAALLYMAFYLVPQWTIIQFPATPGLTPIMNPLTHMAAFGFPLVLAVPGLGIDLVLRKADRIGDWKLAAAIGVMFVALMVAVHWPFAEFLLKSPLAQNDLFLASHWPYSLRLGPFVSQYFGLDVDASANWSALRFMTGLAIATVIAILSARAGLAWGAWMRRVQR